MTTFYKSKSTALKKIVGTTQLLCNRSITKYFILNDHTQFLETIRTESPKDFYEYIPSNISVPLFFDIEIYKDKSPFFDNAEELLDLLFYRITNELPDSINITKIIMESHSDSKKSYHIILQLKRNGSYLLCQSVKDIKALHKKLKLDSLKDIHNKHIIDPSVYREGLFRTLYSSKQDENRPLVKSQLSDDFEDIESFVTYYSRCNNEIIDLSQFYKNVYDPFENQGIDNTIVNVPEDLNEQDKKAITDFIQKEYHHLPNKIRDIFIDSEYNCFVAALNERYCPFEQREHKSNNQYIIIDTASAKQKCHDPDCNDRKHNEIKLENFPIDLNEVIKKCLKINKHERDLIDKTIEECKNYITENYDANVENVTFDRTAMIFRGNVADQNLARLLNGTCPECNVEHQISDNGYCLRCTRCNNVFPKNQMIPVDSRYRTLTNFWTNYSQMINNGTINNIINIYNNSEEDFSCDVQLHSSIIKDKKILKLVNECLDGHKITKMAELMHTLHKDYVFTGNDWYYFDGHKWCVDLRSLSFKRHTLGLCNILNKIKQYYESLANDEKSMSIIKNIKSLVTKLNKPQLKDDILRDAQLFYIDNDFYKRLNSKKHLVPFSNGVYDLLDCNFRKTKKEDYVNLCVGYDYCKDLYNKEVDEFLTKVLPNTHIRNYVLKKFSECLNGDIPNTNFLMFIGDGANGKSQLLNLMKLCMGELGEKVEVTLLTRKRNNANEANTEKIKLMNKRFAFLSEPEDGEKINIGLLKELTGSEEVVARGLYQDSISFVMEAKLFLACNELPEIKGEDTALWRRIRVIDFPSRFVDEPKESNEYNIDRTLPSRMREDVTWKQTFMNILLQYTNKNIPEPEEVKIRTNEYRQDNNEISMWLDDNIEHSEHNILHSKDLYDSLCTELYSTKYSNKQKCKLKTQIEKWIKEKFPNINNQIQNTSIDGQKYKGWLHLKLKD